MRTNSHLNDNSDDIFAKIVMARHCLCSSVPTSLFSFTFHLLRNRNFELWSENLRKKKRRVKSMTIQVLQNNKNLIDKGDFINLQLFILDDLKVPTNAVH